MVSFCIPKLTPPKRGSLILLPRWRKEKNQKNTAISRYATFLAEAGIGLPLPVSQAPRTRDRSSALKKPGRLVPCITPRNTYQETAKYTKQYYWETCRQIINLLGTIKAFRYFWLQMPGTHTHTHIQTSFFAPFE